MTRRADALAETLLQGANDLADLAATLTDAEWQVRVPRDGRTVGVIVHHVATMYPLEIELAQAVAAGNAITGVTWQAVHDINAKHAREHAETTPREAIALLRKNSELAAKAIRAFSDEELDRSAPISLYFDTPLTSQFFLEDHAVRHSWHHLGRIRGALAEQTATVGA
jgi:hypothetical protein